MELEKNIFFNTDKLIEGSTVKISYMGYFFQRSDDEVFIHYGFGNSWSNSNEIKMNKTELGFQATFQLFGTEPLHLCFRNSNGEWDNKFGENFNFEIHPCEKALAVVPENKVELSYKLTKPYMFAKRIKLAFYKIIRYVPRILGFGKHALVDDTDE